MSINYTRKTGMTQPLTDVVDADYRYYDYTAPISGTTYHDDSHGYIQFACGIQICFGRIVERYHGDRITYVKPFARILPTLHLSTPSQSVYPFSFMNKTLEGFTIYSEESEGISYRFGGSYIAIGLWK